MIFLNPWVLFGLIPLYFIYKKHINTEAKRQIHLLYLALFFMLFAISRPALIHNELNQKFKAADYIVALDASYSMQADDLQPSRYIVAKLAIKKLLELHPKDRFTLFAFTSNALLISPPTTDTPLALQALDTLNPHYILTKSTNLLHLFETVAKISQQKKKLIIFSDGGDEHDIHKLITLLKQNAITPYIVATATHKGAVLKKNGKYIKDTHSALVVSKINPMLKDLAAASHGKYYELTSQSVIDKLSNDLRDNTDKKELTMQVKSYRELFFIPLGIALFLYFIAVTKIHQLFIFLPFFLLPYKVDAGMLDFIYLQNAHKQFQQKQYHQAALNFAELEPSVASYYNTATAYYKAGEYKNALHYFRQIKTADAKIKQAIFYDIANCAVHLKKYDIAKIYYVKALALGKDNDALFNLRLLQKQRYKTSKDVLKNERHKQKNQHKSSKEQKEQKSQSESKGASSSNRKSIQSTNGQGGTTKKQKTSILIKQKNRPNKYKMAYKAYEIINKGYANEKEPW
ncbi:VWA domain-containing protein [Sulfurimonas sp.]